jgi:hypothetical protein
MRKRFGVVSLLASTAFAGCGGIPVLDNHDDFYLKVPALKVFRYELRTPDGSRIDGALRFDVTQVDWPDSDEGVYTLHGTLSASFRGRFETRESAFDYAPDDAIRRAMDPEDVSRAWVPFSPEEKSKLGMVGGTATHFYRDRVKTLRLPIEHAWSRPPSALTSSLMGSKKETLEIALVWVKALMVDLHLPFPASVGLGGSLETSTDALVIPLSVSPANGGPETRYDCRFGREAGLLEVRGRLRDGSSLLLVAEAR